MRLKYLKKYRHIYIIMSSCYFCEITQEENMGDFKKCFDIQLKYQQEDQDYSLNRTKSAAQMGHLECLKKAHRQECCSLKGICNIAATYGNLQCLKYGHDNGDVINEKTMENACKADALGIMRYLHDNKCPWNTQVCDIGAEYGHIHCLKYAHENGCPWDEMTIYKAIQNNNFGCLEYACENGCPTDEDMINEACKNNDLRILKYLHENMHLKFDDLSATLCCLKDGKRECLEYAHENGSKITHNTFSLAIENNLLDCIKFLVESMCDYELYTAVTAVKYCDLESIKYLRKNDILLFDDDSCCLAVQNKKISVIKYLIDQGCPFVAKDIMKEIIKYDKLVFLKYFIKKYSLIISKDDFENILKNDSIKCLSYVFCHRALFDSFYDQNTYDKSHGKCRSFIKKKIILKKQI